MVRLILWLVPNDPLSKQALRALEAVTNVLPPEVQTRVREVNAECPEVQRAPAFLLKKGARVIARHEGVLAAEEILSLVRRHS
jgi:hypothetical protein